MKKTLKTVFAILTAAAVFAALPLCSFADGGAISVYFRYRHDPRLNPAAMADIVVDPEAVYGFSPSPDGSLASYVSYDWTDPELVNGENGRLARIAYHESMSELYDLMFGMEEEGCTVEEIARAVSARRNELRMESYEGDPEGLAAMKARNLEKYGHEEGPLPDELYEQYGSWETVLSKAFSVNAGMDACFGLYDDYYDVYIMVGQITEDESLSREYVISLFVDLILGGEADDSDQADIAALFEDGGDASGWFAPELERAAEFIVGYEDGTLRPGGAVTRAETAAFLFRLLSDRGYLGDGGGAPEFSDLPAWAADDINSLFRAGILLGCGGGVFGSDDSLTAEQLRLIVDRVCEMLGRD